MIRGTTPVLSFELPIETSNISVGYVTIFQRNSMVIEKKFSDCELQQKKVIMKLTQTETLKLSSNDSVEIQIRCKTNLGEAFASDIIKVSVKRILKDGEI